MLDLLCCAFIRSHIRFQILIKRQPTTFKVKVNWVYKIMDLLAFALPTISGQERLEVLIDSWTRISSQKSLWHIVTFSALLRLRQFRQSTKFRENVKIQIKSVLQYLHEITQYVEVANMSLSPNCSSQQSLVHWLSTTQWVALSFLVSCLLSRHRDIRPNLTSTCPRPPKPIHFQKAYDNSYSKMNREHKCKDKDKYNDKDKDKIAERITESLTVCYIFAILMTQAFQVWWWIPPLG